MLKVVLIDDEAVILLGLKKLIDWNRLGFMIVGEAKDGEEGLEVIRETKPDVVISDIAMPGLSGIEMLKQLSGSSIEVKTIFLSGYQEFSYAKEALRYGAVDYLLKPVSPADLTQVLQEVTRQIQEEHSYHMLRKKDSPAELLFQKMQQENRSDMVRNLLEDLNDGDKNQGAVCAALKLFIKNSQSMEENKSLLRFEIYEFIQEYLENQLHGFIIKKDLAACYVILPEENDRGKLKKQLNILADSLRSIYAVEVVVGVGAWTDCSGKVMYLYKTAKFALEMYYFLEKKYIDYEEVSREYEHSLEEYQEKVKKLQERIATEYSSDDLIQEIIECVELLGAIHYGNKNAVMNSCVLLSADIFSTLLECGLIDESSRGEQAEFLEEIRRKATLSTLVTLFQDYYNQIFLKIRLLCRHRESAEIVRVKYYIEQHFKDNISLGEIAEYVGMNTSYMSAFFKKETGQNFKTYLTEVRMKEALKLLNTTEMRSYEIADAVGYKDAKQFRENFKELYGISPQQYRKRGKL